MGHTNAEVVRAYVGAVGGGEADRAVELVTDDVVMHVPGRNPISGEVRGRDALLTMLREVFERSGGSFGLEIHDILASDDHVVALLERTIAGIETRVAVVYHLRDGKIAEIWPHEQDQYALDEALSGP
jgi:uncharacterized protein